MSLNIRRFVNPAPGVLEELAPMWVIEVGPVNFIVWAETAGEAEEALSQILTELDDAGPSFHPALVSVEQ